MYDCVINRYVKSVSTAKGYFMDRWLVKWSEFIPGKIRALFRHTMGTYPIEETSIGLLTAKMQSVATIRIYLAAYPLNARLNCVTKLHRFAYLSFFLIN